MTPRQLVDFYAERGPEIFPRASEWSKALRQIVRSKYTNVALEQSLKHVFGSLTLGDASKRLVVPSFNLDADEVYVFKTPHHARLRRDYKVPLWQVAMATSAAPSYLPSFVLPQDRIRLIDGGVWANNPVVVGIAEATSLLGAPLDSVRVLSLGTSSEVKHRNKRLNNGGLIQWARGSTVVDVLLRGQSIGANGLAQHLVGPEDVLRIDPVVPANVLKLDSADSDRLISMAASNSRIESPLFFDRFTDHVAPAFEPHYSTTDTHRG
jgi:patatin-like phospholipase/acyl hydrolase